VLGHEDLAEPARAKLAEDAVVAQDETARVAVLDALDLVGGEQVGLDQMLAQAGEAADILAAELLDLWQFEEPACLQVAVESPQY
jgi:hypothetical protein